MFKLSSTSLDKLHTVDERLQKVVLRAIELTKVDFGVICGIRTLAEQEALVAAGASQTMKSKHLEGKAVDLMAYIGSRASWEANLYDDIADAMKAAAIEQNIPIRWGGAWTVPDITQWRDDMRAAQNSYIDTRRGMGQRPFIDNPHFELA